MEENLKRDFAMDLLKCFAIWAVIWGHSIQYLQNGDYFEDSIYIWIYSFHMPLFMMIAGYFCESSMRMQFYDFIKKEILHLLTPAFATGGILVLSHFFIDTYFGYEIKYATYLNQFLGSMWFLKCLFFCYIFCYIMLKFPNAFVFFCILITLIFFDLISTFCYHLLDLFPVFVFGFYYRKYRKSLSLNVSMALLISCSVYLLMFYMLHYYETGLDTFIVYLFRLLRSVSASVMFITIAQGWNRTSVSVSPFFIRGIGIIGSNTLGIYCVQSVFLETLLPLLFRTSNTLVSRFFLIPLLSFFFLIIATVLCMYFSKWKLTCLIFLGKRK